MLENWLSPIHPDPLKSSELEDFQLGTNVGTFTTEIPDLSNTKLAIIGIGVEEANMVRRALYKMSFPFKDLQIADLGNFKKTAHAFVIPLIKELLESKIIPIIIGNSPDFIAAQYRAFKSLKEMINITLVDESIPFTGDPDSEKSLYLDEILTEKRSHLFHLGIVGCQRHYTIPQAKKIFDKLHFEYIGLGNARNNLNEIEPVIRDADLLGFNLSAMKQAEAPAQANPTPTGFTVEDACRISRYAGMSDKLRSFGVFGFKEQDLGNEQTAEVVAQMIWYFIDGYNNRKNDFPVSTKGLMEYIVNFKNEQIVFWKSQRSGRWWLQIPVMSDKKYQRHYLVPCSYSDYKLASNEELPDRLVNAFKRFH
jgi:formiminoglutamase